MAKKNPTISNKIQFPNSVSFPDESTCLQSLIKILNVVIPRNNKIEGHRLIHNQNSDLKCYSKNIAKVIFASKHDDEKNQLLITCMLHNIKHITQQLQKVCLTDYTYQMTQEQLNKILLGQYFIPTLAIYILAIPSKVEANLGHSISLLLTSNPIKEAIQKNSGLLDALKEVAVQNIHKLSKLPVNVHEDDLRDFKKKYIYRLNESDFASNLFKSNQNSTEKISYSSFKELLLTQNKDSDSELINQINNIFFIFEACYVLKRLQKKINELVKDDTYFYLLLNDLTCYLLTGNRQEVLSDRQHLLLDINESFQRKFIDYIFSPSNHTLSNSGDFERLSRAHKANIISWQQLLLLPLPSSTKDSRVNKEYSIIAKNRLKKMNPDIQLSFFNPLYYPIANASYTSLMQERYQDVVSLLDYDLCPYDNLIKNPFATSNNTSINISLTPSLQDIIQELKPTRGFGTPLSHYCNAIFYLSNQKIDEAYSEIKQAYKYIKLWPLGSLSTNICTLLIGLSICKSNGKFKSNQYNSEIMLFLKHHFAHTGFSINGNNILFGKGNSTNSVDYDKTASFFIILGFNFLLNLIKNENNKSFINRLYINPLSKLESILYKNPMILSSDGQKYIELIEKYSNAPIRFIHSNFEANDLEKNAEFYLFYIQSNLFGPIDTLPNSIQLLNKITNSKPDTNEQFYLPLPIFKFGEKSTQ